MVRKMKGEAAPEIISAVAGEYMIRLIENNDRIAAFVFAHAGNDKDAVKLAVQMSNINKENVRKYLTMTGEELESMPENEKSAIKKDGEEYSRLFKKISTMHVVENEYNGRNN